MSEGMDKAARRQFVIDRAISRINWDAEGLEEARALHEAGKDAEAFEAVIAHLRTRENPKYLFERADMEAYKDPAAIEEIMREVDLVMDHTLYGYHYEGEIDWFFSPLANTSQDREWCWSLYRMIYLQPLARAYVLNGNEEYTKQFLWYLESFYDNCPVDPYMADPDYSLGGGWTGAWRHIETGIRFYTALMPCYVAFRRSEAWDTAGWAYFLNMVYDSAEYLMVYYTNHIHSSNWLSMETTGLLQCGVLFPELKNSEEWRRMGYRRFSQEVMYSFDEDGIHMERTPIYHMTAAVCFTQCYDICRKNGIPVPDYALPILENAAAFLMAVTKPDFTTQMTGDADRNNLLAIRSDEALYEGMNLSFWPQDLNEMRGFIRHIADLTGRKDLLYIATGRKQGEEPARNYPFKASGFYIMRTGWGQKDSYFALQGLRIERGEHTAHVHNDTGHFELQIGGTDILVDTGRFIYGRTAWQEWREYFMSSRAHNTLEVENRLMGHVPGDREFCARAWLHRFEEGKAADGKGNEIGYQLIDMSHNGYSYADDPMNHRRMAARLDGDIFGLADEVTGLALTQHDINLWFNFAPGELEIDGSKAIYTTEKGERFVIAVLTPEDANPGVVPELKRFKGDLDPIGGWVSYGYAVKEPAPQLCVTYKCAAPMRSCIAIAPEAAWNAADKESVKAVFGKIFSTK
ncbi:MAG: alginate lyase family protein [Firmicutes bacterium]|nr:alginate lyase family protein [Bacillota bacterium]